MELIPAKGEREKTYSLEKGDDEAQRPGSKGD
jgi:hypothetical protein